MYVQSAPNSLFDDMLQVWRDLPCAEGVKVPAKKSFAPSMLTKHLQNLGIAEHRGEGRLSIRLAGTNSRQFWGKEMTGTSLEDIATDMPENVMVPPMILEAVFRHPCGMRSLREAEDKRGHSWQVDMLSLPFANGRGEVKFLLYGYRIAPKDESVPQTWEPGFADFSTARLVGAEFVDIGQGCLASLQGLYVLRLLDKEYRHLLWRLPTQLFDRRPHNAGQLQPDLLRQFLAL